MKNNNKNIALASTIKLLLLALIFICGLSNSQAKPAAKQDIHALYIPLADHYAALVAYERYRHEMKYASFQITKMQSWDLLRAYFLSGEVDMAFSMTPLAISMYQEEPHFRWIGLMHRDGNALAINDLLNKHVKLPPLRKDRLPNSRTAEAFKLAYKKNKTPIEIAVPHLLSTHSVVLYRYLKEHNLKLSLDPFKFGEVRALAIAPPKSPAFIRGKSNRAQAAAFEQSLPWADVVETGAFGHVAWYSKDVMPWKHGHVECIALATNNAINTKFKATKEVMYYIHQAGNDIEEARAKGGETLQAIVDIIRKHIPAHTEEAIIASLSAELRVINYTHLNIDKGGLKQIMDLAIEGGILSKPINIDEFADERFNKTTPAQ